MAEITPDDFFRDEPPARIIGVETEYNRTKVRRFTSSEPEPLYPRLRKLGSSEFYENGARIYIDLKELVEYATPECLGPADCARHEQAGHRFAWQYANDSNRSMLIFNTTAYYNPALHDAEPKPSTTGHHENYLLPLTTSKGSIPPMLSLLAVRNVLVGSGLPKPDGGFACGAKAVDIGEEVGTKITKSGEKPMIYAYDSIGNHADRLKWQRLEVRCGDASISPWATFMKLALSSVLLRRVERKAFPDTLLVKNPLDTFHQVSGHLTGIVKIETNGGTMTTLEWIYDLARWVLETSKDVKFPPDEIVAAEAAIEACDDAAVDPLSLHDRTDHAAKCFILYARGHDRDFASARNLQLSWGCIDREKGVGIRWSEAGKLRPIPIEQEDFDPTDPPNTRAHDRFRLVGPNKYPSNYSVDWGRVINHMLPEPYRTLA
jgi:hypothetical protein